MHLIQRLVERVRTLTHTVARLASADVYGRLVGLFDALAVLPVLLTLGLPAYALLGAVAPQVGVVAASVTAAIGGLARAAISRTRLPCLARARPRP